LTESHLACHTYPEYGTATFNLYCCRSRPEWDWESELRSALSAGSVTVTKLERGKSGPLDAATHDVKGQAAAAPIELGGIS
jgi:S-adenosylmethionine decarboxylase